MLPKPEEENMLFLMKSPAEGYPGSDLGIFALRYTSAELAENAENQFVDNMKFFRGGGWDENTFYTNGYDAFGIFKSLKAEAVVRKSKILYFIALDWGGGVRDVHELVLAILSDLLENGIPK